MVASKDEAVQAAAFRQLVPFVARIKAFWQCSERMDQCLPGAALELVRADDLASQQAMVKLIVDALETIQVSSTHPARRHIAGKNTLGAP